MIIVAIDRNNRLFCIAALIAKLISSTFSLNHILNIYRSLSNIACWTTSNFVITYNIQIVTFNDRR